MRSCLSVLAVFAGTLFGIYLVFWIGHQDAVIRYRLTVAVDVDGVTHKGSGVVQITYSESMLDAFLEQQGASWGQVHGSMKGYAITVDLGERGVLYVVNFTPLLRDGRPSLAGAPFLDELPYVVGSAMCFNANHRYPEAGPSSEVLACARIIRHTKPEPVALPVTELPMMVRFAYSNDRSSIEEVDPRDLAAAFGPGVRLASATYELTRDPISPMPKIWPAWLKLAKDGPITGEPYHPYFTVHGTMITVGMGTSVFKGD